MHKQIDHVVDGDIYSGDNHAREGSTTPVGLGSSRRPIVSRCGCGRRFVRVGSVVAFRVARLRREVDDELIPELRPLRVLTSTARTTGTAPRVRWQTQMEFGRSVFGVEDQAFTGEG